MKCKSHLDELFTRLELPFTPQARTEASNNPDFIFPGEREYHDAKFNAALLVMLSVKSTSKDRWRQVLTEADEMKRHLTRCPHPQPLSHPMGEGSVGLSPFDLPRRCASTAGAERVKRLCVLCVPRGK